MKKKICWVTASYMLQVDLPILSTLNKSYNIDWYFWGNQDDDSGKTAKQYAEENHIPLKYIESPNTYNPSSIPFCNTVIKKLKDKKYDLYYFNIITFPWLLFSIKKHLPSDRIAIAMHHGKIHSGMRFKTLYRPFLKYLNKQPFNLQYFSKNQAEAFNGKDLNKKFLIPLALNNFGEANQTVTSDKVIFTVFGNIIETKNIPLLIEAGNQLWKRFNGKFRIRIIGRGKYWQTCTPLIRHQEAFELDIRRVDDTEIPDIFASSHYIVFPYKAVTQSGPLRIAYGYNVPVITSNLEGFKESVEENITGLMFQSENVESLINVMSNAISNHPQLYKSIKKTQSEYIKHYYSNTSVSKKYSEMIDQILSVK